MHVNVIVCVLTGVTAEEERVDAWCRHCGSQHHGNQLELAVHVGWAQRIGGRIFVLSHDEEITRSWDLVGGTGEELLAKPDAAEGHQVLTRRESKQNVSVGMNDYVWH